MAVTPTQSKFQLLPWDGEKKPPGAVVAVMGKDTLASNVKEVDVPFGLAMVEIVMCGLDSVDTSTNVFVTVTSDGVIDATNNTVTFAGTGADAGDATDGDFWYFMIGRMDEVAA